MIRRRPAIGQYVVIYTSTRWGHGRVVGHLATKPQVNGLKDAREPFLVTVTKWHNGGPY